MEGLNIDNILTEDDINSLFVDEDDTKEKQETSPESEVNEDKKEKTTEEVDVEGLFSETPESVGSEEHQDGEDTTSEKKPDSSPKDNNKFYSSIAKAFKEDGVFTDLDDNSIEDIKDAEDFAELVRDQIKKGLDEQQKRVYDALNAGMDEDEIRQYENALKYLDSIKESDIESEEENGTVIRKRLIYQDLLNKGYSKEEAEEELNEIFENGSDVRKAKRALNANKEFFRNNYENALKEYKEEAEKDKQRQKKQAEELKKSILEDKVVFGDLQIDKATRQKVYDNISKPIYKDKETGELLTALQKYEKENKTEFLKNLSLVFTLTDGFKDLSKLVKSKVNKEVKKGLRELEHTLNNTSRTSDGNLKFVSGITEDPESSERSWTLDI